VSARRDSPRRRLQVLPNAQVGPKTYAPQSVLHLESLAAHAALARLMAVDPGSRRPRPASPRPSPFSCLSSGLSPARRASHSHPRLPAARTWCRAVCPGVKARANDRRNLPVS
jgi:hypothetical protein